MPSSWRAKTNLNIRVSADEKGGFVIDPILKQQIDLANARLEFSRNIVLRSRTVLDLARALMQVPPVPAYLRSLSEIKRAQRSITHEAEIKAKKLIDAAVKELSEKVGDANFAREKSKLLGDLRYLNPYLSVVVRNAERSIRQIQAAPLETDQKRDDTPRPRGES